MKVSLHSLQEAPGQAAYANRARIRFPGSWQQAGTAAWSFTGAPEKMLSPISSVEVHTDNEQAWENGFAKCSVGRKLD